GRVAGRPAGGDEGERRGAGVAEPLLVPGRAALRTFALGHLSRRWVRMPTRVDNKMSPPCGTVPPDGRVVGWGNHQPSGGSDAANLTPRARSSNTGAKLWGQSSGFIMRRRALARSWASCMIRFSS